MIWFELLCTKFEHKNGLGDTITSYSVYFVSGVLLSLREDELKDRMDCLNKVNEGFEGKWSKDNANVFMVVSVNGCSEGGDDDDDGDIHVRWIKPIG